MGPSFLSCLNLRALDFTFLLLQLPGSQVSGLGLGGALRCPGSGAGLLQLRLLSGFRQPNGGSTQPPGLKPRPLLGLLHTQPCLEDLNLQFPMLQLFR